LGKYAGQGYALIIVYNFFPPDREVKVIFPVAAIFLYKAFERGIIVKYKDSCLGFEGYLKFVL